MKVYGNKFTCFNCVLRVPPSGDGREGIVESLLGFAGGLMAAESKSTSQTSSGTMGSLLYFRKEEGRPMTYGVGASKSCSEPGMEVGRIGIRGNMYCRG